MKLLALVVALAVSAGTAQASRAHPAGGALVNLNRTSLGTVLVDARGRTLYLFEEDRNGVSMCNTACLSYWPALTSQATPRAGNGVQQSQLRLARAHNGVRQVTYAGHPLYTFVGDKRAGQTTGQGLDNFGGGWYALTPDGHKIPSSHTGHTGGYGY